MGLLEAFLEQKGKEYAPFDTKRVHRIYAVLKPHLEELYAQSAKSKKDLESLIPQSKERCSFSTQNKPFIIHILGTNGKGSTGRFITLGLAQNGYKVLHFTSPHLFRFNERFYLANIPNSDLSAKSGSANSSKKDCAKDCGNAHKGTHRIADDSELEKAHLWLQRFPIIEQSSYFEYATFLALYLAKDCDYFVCEAGLGGEFDSTSVLQADLSVFTPIGIDHEEFLGNTIASIASTKLRAMGKNVLLSPQRFPKCKKIAKDIAQEKSANLFEIPKLCNPITRKQPALSLMQNFEKYTQNFSQTFHNTNLKTLDYTFWCGFSDYISKNAYAQFLQQNIVCAIFALLFCNLRFDFTTLKPLDLRGRCENFKPNILLDVGHNIECAKALKYAIVQKFGKKNVILVYNTYFDKAVLEILGILKPVISEVLILKVKNERIIDKVELEKILDNLELRYSDFAPAKLQKDCNYVVFGSFSVVAEFLTTQDYK